jgi:hypothetical protein
MKVTPADKVMLLTRKLKTAVTYPELLVSVGFDPQYTLKALRKLMALGLASKTASDDIAYYSLTDPNPSASALDLLSTAPTHPDANLPS